jgi:hypothetical protein
VLADEVISIYGLPGEGWEYFFRQVEIYERRAAAPLGVLEQSSAVRSDHGGCDL